MFPSYILREPPVFLPVVRALFMVEEEQNMQISAKILQNYWWMWGFSLLTVFALPMLLLLCVSVCLWVFLFNCVSSKVYMCVLYVCVFVCLCCCNISKMSPKIWNLKETWQITWSFHSTKPLKYFKRVCIQYIYIYTYMRSNEILFSCFMFMCLF